MPRSRVQRKGYRAHEHQESSEAALWSGGNVLGGEPGPQRSAGDHDPALPRRAAGGRGMSLKVLIVDDEPLAREGIKLMLSSDSQVIEARNGREAVAKIREEKPA